MARKTKKKIDVTDHRAAGTHVGTLPGVRLETLPGGGTRSERAPGHHLVPREGIIRTARRFDLGAAIHGPDNWKKSCYDEASAREWCIAAYNHMMEHALKMSPSSEDEMIGEEASVDDHLGAIGWAVCVIAYCEARFQKRWKDLAR